MTQPMVQSQGTSSQKVEWHWLKLHYTDRHRLPAEAPTRTIKGAFS